jgi:hypothetical protein
MSYYNITTKIIYYHIKLTNVTESKFLGLIIDNTLTWKQHTDYVINKVSSACYVGGHSVGIVRLRTTSHGVCVSFVCYALRNIEYIIPLDTLKLIYFAHIYSIISYGIIFWDGPSCANKFFILQEKAVRIITNSRPRWSCRDLLKNLEILTF